MGGCRCVFRNCNVTTSRNPGMHFFHFPVKDRERFEKWAKMAGVEHVLKLPEIQSKNRVVCARHFPDDSFMNYKKNRLMPRAVPTLMRFSNGMALDYAHDLDEPKVIRIEKPTQPHLIPPPDFKCPLEMEPSETFEASMLAEPADDCDKINFVHIERAERCKRKRTSEQSARTPSNKITILNILHLGESDRGETVHDEEEVRICDNGSDEVVGTLSTGAEIAEFIMNEDNSSEKVDIYELNDLLGTDETDAVESASQDETSDSLFPQNDLVLDLQQQLKAERSEHATSRKSLLERILMLEERLQAGAEQLERTKTQLQVATEQNDELAAVSKKLTNTNNALQRQHEALRSAHTKSETKLAIASASYKRLEEVHKELQTSHARLESEQEAHAKAALKSVPAAAVASAAPPSKAQLFNGIKKYLSSSMVALVRMEMFGSAEREWKPDERRTAVELLKLGEHIFRYFSDEWRFRLPSLRQVRSWHNEAATLEEEEDL